MKQLQKKQPPINIINLPYNIDAEQLVIGSCLLDPHAIHMACSILTDFMFFDAQNKIIFSCITEMYKSSKKIDIITLSDFIKSKGHQDNIGSISYLVSATSRIASTAHIEQHCIIVKENWIRRILIQQCWNIISKSSAYEDPLSILSNSIAELNKVLTNISTTKTISIKESATDTIINILNDSEPIKYIKSGIPELDAITGGFAIGDFVLLAGRPQHGKTTLAILMALYNALHNIPTGFISLEMGHKQLSMKILSAQSNIPIYSIRSGNLSDMDKQNLEKAYETISDIPLFISDKRNVSIEDIISLINVWKYHYNIELVFIDYLQLIRTRSDYGNRENQVSEISRSIKRIAADMNITLIGISPLSRDIEKRSGLDKRPKNSDLRESGSLEYDPDVIIFAFRPENSNIYTYPDGASTKDSVELIVSKNRLGTLGSVRMSINNSTGILSPFNNNTNNNNRTFSEHPDIYF